MAFTFLALYVAHIIGMFLTVAMPAYVVIKLICTMKQQGVNETFAIIWMFIAVGQSIAGMITHGWGPY